MKRKSFYKKKYLTSIALKLAMLFAIGIATVVLIFSAITTILMREAVMRQQKDELLFYADELSKDWHFANADKIHFEANVHIPYYYSYTIFRKDGDEAIILSSNDQFLPIFEDTNEDSIKFTDDDYYIDGKLSMLYVVIPVQTELNEKLRFESNKVPFKALEKGIEDAPENFEGIPVARADFENTYVQVSIDIDRDTGQSMISTMPLVFLVVAVPLLMLSFLLALFFVRRSLKPVSEMTTSAQKIGSENLDARLLHNGSGDELDTLAKTFNDLFSRLEIDFKRERQFTSDVSHELKTPLAVISGHVNLLRRWGKDDPDQLVKSIASIATESKNMQKIIENLLELSHAENGQLTSNLIKVPLVPLFNRLESELRLYAPTAQLSFNYVQPNKNNVDDKTETMRAFDKNMFAVLADENMLHEVLNILLSNSVRYSPDPAHITITADLHVHSSNMSKIAITVTDKGCGISAEALPHVFERFYREDKAHTRTVTSGSGLGLAIAKALITAMGGEIKVNTPSLSETGASFTIVLSQASLDS